MSWIDDVDIRKIIRSITNQYWGITHKRTIQHHELQHYVEQYLTDDILLKNRLHYSNELIQYITNTIYDDVNQELQNKSDKQSIWLLDYYGMAKRETQKRAMQHKQIVPRSKFRTEIMKRLDDDIVDQLYDEVYLPTYEEFHKQDQPKQPKPRDKPIKEKIKDFVIIHAADDLLSYNDFIKIIKDWNRHISLKEAYEYYKSEYFKIPGATVNINEPEDVYRQGFKNMQGL